MSSFTYRAVNDDNKEVRGQIDAIDFDSAKRALEEAHLDVVEMHEASRSGNAQLATEPSEQPALKTTFAFEGTDSAGTVRRGTIQAETKYQAFERLKHDQKLFVAMLSPLGVLPQYRDNDLENWQRKEIEEKQLQKAPAKESPVPALQQKPKSIGFAMTPSPKPLASVPASSPVVTAPVYHPLVSTLRLYAGWLLAWYGLFVALGYYAHVRALQWYLPFVEAFYLSSLIFSFIVAIFLFLMLGSIHRSMHGRIMSGIFLTIIGIGLFVGVRMSVA